MQDNPSIQFDEQRLAKRQQLIEEGVTLYPPEFRRSHSIESVRNEFCDVGHDPSAQQVITNENCSPADGTPTDFRDRPAKN